MPAKNPKKYRLSDETLAQLAELAEANKLNHTAMIEQLIADDYGRLIKERQQAELAKLPEVYGWSEPRIARTPLMCGECEQPIAVGQRYCKADMSNKSDWYAHASCVETED